MSWKSAVRLPQVHACAKTPSPPSSPLSIDLSLRQPKGQGRLESHMKRITSAFSASRGLIVSTLLSFSTCLWSLCPSLPRFVWNQRLVFMSRASCPLGLPPVMSVLAAAYGYPLVLNNFTPTALLVCSPASSFVACACSPVGLCFVWYPSLLAPLALQQSSCSRPATSIQLAPMAVRRSHAWCMRVCACMCVCRQLSDAVQMNQLDYSIWKHDTGLQMCHQACTMLLGTICIAWIACGFVRLRLGMADCRCAVEADVGKDQ